MRFIIDILIDNQHKMTYKIGAENEEEALDKLSMRFLPEHRDLISVDSIQPYQKM